MISVIIPVYNSSRYLSECIESVLNQTYKDYEIVLVDDGSTDNSATICLKYASLSKSVRFYSKKNTGVSDSRNYGLTRARGEFVMFLDSDDYVDPCMLKTLISEYNNCSLKPDLVISGLCFVYPDGKNENRVLPTIAFLKSDFNKHYINIEKNSGLNAPVAKLFKRSVIEENSIAFEKEMSILEDQTFVSRYLSCCNSVLTLSYCGYFYRQTSNLSLVKSFNENGLFCLEKKYETDLWLRELLDSESLNCYYKKHFLLFLGLISKVFKEKRINIKTKKKLFIQYKNSPIADIICKRVLKNDISLKQRCFLLFYKSPSFLSFFILNVLL